LIAPFACLADPLTLSLSIGIPFMAGKNNNAAAA
jgi:hypothetical protein